MLWCRPQVIINTMCPGLVNTDLSRSFAEKSAAFVVFKTVFYGLFGKSAANGARTYVAAGLTKEEEHVSVQQFHIYLTYQGPSLRSSVMLSRKKGGGQLMAKPEVSFPGPLTFLFLDVLGQVHPVLPI